MTSPSIQETEKKIRERAEKGDFTLVEPLDFKLLEILPEVGTLFAGMYPLGETVKNIAKKMPTHEGQDFPTKIVFGRIRSMELQGLVAQTRGGNSQRVWQRTQRGSKVFKEWEAKHGSGK